MEELQASCGGNHDFVADVNAGRTRTQKGNGIRQCESPERSLGQGKVAQSQPRGLGKPLQQSQFYMQLLCVNDWISIGCIDASWCFCSELPIASTRYQPVSSYCGLQELMEAMDKYIVGGLGSVRLPPPWNRCLFRFMSTLVDFVSECLRHCENPSTTEHGEWKDILVTNNWLVLGKTNKRERQIQLLLRSRKRPCFTSKWVRIGEQEPRLTISIISYWKKIVGINTTKSYNIKEDGTCILNYCDELGFHLMWLCVFCFDSSGRAWSFLTSLSPWVEKWSVWLFYVIVELDHINVWG